MKKINIFLVTILFLFLCGCNYDKEVIIAQREVYDVNFGSISETWTIYFKDGYVDSMIREMVFESKEDAARLYDILTDTYKEYPQYNFTMDNNRILYNADRTPWIHYNYKEMCQSIDGLLGWTVVEDDQS